MHPSTTEYSRLNNLVVAELLATVVTKTFNRLIGHPKDEQVRRFTVCLPQICYKCTIREGFLSFCKTDLRFPEHDVFEICSAINDISCLSI